MLDSFLETKTMFLPTQIFSNTTFYDEWTFSLKAEIGLMYASHPLSFLNSLILFLTVLSVLLPLVANYPRSRVCFPFLACLTIVLYSTELDRRNGMLLEPSFLGMDPTISLAYLYLLEISRSRMKGVANKDVENVLAVDLSVEALGERFMTLNVAMRSLATEFIGAFCLKNSLLDMVELLKVC